MTDARPVLDQVNVIVSDMDAALRFYRLLGVEIPNVFANWPPGSGAAHANGHSDEGASLDLDNLEMARLWNPDRPASGGSGAVIGFKLPSRDAVDDTWAKLTGAGYTSRQEPFDAFFGARYAIVADPDGNDVGLMSPVDDAKKYVPKP